MWICENIIPLMWSVQKQYELILYVNLLQGEMVFHLHMQADVEIKVLWVQRCFLSYNQENTLWSRGEFWHF